VAETTCFAGFAESAGFKLRNRRGFTSLLAAFGALLRPATADSIRENFARVPVSAMRTTLAAKRNAAYTEFANAA